MINIVIPMAGAGSRFARNGFSLPKPLISVHGIPMIRLVIENIRPSCPHRFIFVAQNCHIKTYGLKEKLTHWISDCSIVGIDGLTDGAACTVLKACSFINNNEPLMIVNSDQYIDARIDDYLNFCNNYDGAVMTMHADNPKWSFIERDKSGIIKRIVEKEVISDEASVGIYNFARGCDFVSAAEEMINSDMRINGEFYVAPVYNLLIARGKRIACYTIGSVGNGMYGLGTPEDLADFLALPLSKRVVEAITC